MAAHLAIHHGLSGLLWYWDLKLVLDRWSTTLDWQGLATRAQRWRVRSALFFTLRGVCDRFEMPALVQAMTARIAPRGPRPAAVRWLVARRAHRLRDLEHVIPLLLTDRFPDVLRAVGGSMLPSPSWIRARYGSESSSLARGYLAHGARLATVVWRTGQQVTGR